jgi:hypothetical protein
MVAAIALATGIIACGQGLTMHLLEELIRVTAAKRD